MIPQLLIEVDGRFAEEMAHAFGAGAFTEWLAKIRTILPVAWSSTEDAPPICVVLTEELEDKLMTDEERKTIERLDFDEDGTAQAGRFAISVTPVKLPMKDIPVTVPVRICSVPAKEKTQ